MQIDGWAKIKATVHVKLNPACYICAEPNNPVTALCHCCGMPTPPAMDYGIVAASDIVKPGFLAAFLKGVRDGKRGTHDQGG